MFRTVQNFLLLSLLMALVFQGIASENWIPFGNADQPVYPEVRVVDSDATGLTIHYRLAGILSSDIQREGEWYQMVRLPGEGFSADIGLPQVPAITRYMAVPPQANISVQVLKSQFRMLDDFNLYPAQEPLPDLIGFDDGSVKFQKNEQVYQKNEFFPQQIVQVQQPQIIHGLGVSLVGVFPVQCNPVTHQLRVYTELMIRIDFTGGNGFFTDESRRNAYFEPLYRNLLINYPALGEFSKSFSEVEYLIITHDNYLSEAQNLAEWKKRKGVSTHIIRVPTDVAADNAAIKDSIEYYYQTYNTSFVILIGDHTDIPTWYVTTHPYHGTKTATDLYYSTLEGNDYFPDIFIGRLPVDPGSAHTVVQKIIDYESDVYTDQTDWFTRPLIAGYFQDSDNNGRADRFFLQTAESIRHFLGLQGYDSLNYVYTTQSTASQPWYYYYGDPIPSWLNFSSTGTSDVIQAINNGCFLIQHRDHGSVSGWGDPYFTTSNIASLSNGKMLPVVFSINCQTGWFDNSSDCFCEAFLKKSNGGCVSIFGATRVSYSGYNDELSKGFYDAIWPDFHPGYPTASNTNPYLDAPYYNLGIVLNYGKYTMYDKYVLTNGSGYPWSPDPDITITEFEEFHLFGCPELELYTGVPEPLSVQHPTHISTPTTLTLTVRSNGQPVEGALVCLYKNGEVYLRDYTPASGELTFNIPATGEGALYVTATKHNYKAYLGTISCGGPIITVSPDSFQVSLLAGDSTTDILTIGNTGTSVLNWTITENSKNRIVLPAIDLPKGAPDVQHGPEVTRGSGGPDNFGYKWIDSDEAGGPTFDWIDISGTGTVVTGLSDDNFVGPFDIGFQFSFYGTEYSRFYICSNGMIGFGPTINYDKYSNGDIPATDTPNNILAWCWDDLHPRNGTVYYSSDGDRLIIQFKEYGRYSPSTATINAEVIIYKNGTILYQYKDFSSDFTLTSCTIGIENIDGNDGLRVVYNNSYLHSNLAVRFMYQDWLTVSPQSGSVQVNTTQDVTVKLNARELSEGDYDGMITIQSNDPITPTTNVPVHLHVYANRVLANVKIYLEGPFAADTMSTYLQRQGLLPLSQPFNQAPWNYQGTEQVSAVPGGVVDWVMLELRTGTAAGTRVARRAAFLRKDGIVVDTDGTSQVSFMGIEAGDYYVVVHHRNHLSVMTATAITLSSDNSTLYDFTDSPGKAYDAGSPALKALDTGHYGMFAGDADASGTVDNQDKTGVWQVQNGTAWTYDKTGDFNLDGAIDAQDYNRFLLVNSGKQTQVP